MKTCPKCGAQADGIFCINCGAAVNSEPAAAPAPQPQQPVQPQQPYYPPQQPVQPQQPYYPPQQPYYPAQPPVEPEKPGMATAAIVFAFLIPLVNSLAHPKGIYRTEGISQTLFISQIPKEFISLLLLQDARQRSR